MAFKFVLDNVGFDLKIVLVFLNHMANFERIKWDDCLDVFIFVTDRFQWIHKTISISFTVWNAWICLLNELYYVTFNLLWSANESRFEMSWIRPFQSDRIRRKQFRMNSNRNGFSNPCSKIVELFRTSAPSHWLQFDATVIILRSTINLEWIESKRPVT